ncbi:PorV/PorQ family protein [bacterium]|nr:PorV/PorQ family protein [bacterium]
MHVSAVLLVLLCLTTARAEQGSGGLESPFDAIGVSARDFGMGGTAVAMPKDMGAFMWNSAGMVVVEHQCVGFSKTTLFEGSQYHFLGYIFPTLSAGTFGLGVSHLGTDGIRHFEDINGVPVEMGAYNYWWGKLSLAYAHSLFGGLSAGLNFDAHRQELGPYNTNGFGLDAGLHYKTPARGGVLQDLYFGFNYKNALQPRLKLGTGTENLPSLFRFGAAKVFSFNQRSVQWALLWDYEKHEHKSAVQHIGTEFNWRGLAFIRSGFNNGDLTFGGGLRIKGIQIDYGSGQLGNPDIMPRSHRFSLSLFLGKSLPEKRRQILAAQEQEIRQQVMERQESEKRKRIQEGIETGKQYYTNGDYFNARLTFTRVLSEDPNNAEAQKYLGLTKDKEDEQQQAREAELRQQSIEEDQRKRNEVFIREQYDEGLRALDEGDFQKAIEKWEQALARDPENTQIRSYIDKAREELDKEINRLIFQAKSLIRQENLAEARRVLDRAKSQTENNEALRNKVMVEIRRLDNTVNYMNNYQLGRENYEKGNFKAAADYLEKALQLQPNDSEVRELYQSARARSIGKKKEMNSEVRAQYAEGLRIYSKGRYQEALEIWEKALAMDPENIKIIEAIEIVKRRLKEIEQQQ